MSRGGRRLGTMRRRDDGNGSINTGLPNHHHSSTGGDGDGGAGDPCCGCRDNTSAAAAAATAVTKPAGRRRRYLATSTLALCTVAFLLQDNLGRAAQKYSRAAPTNSSAVAVADVEADLESLHLPYRLDDGGPGPPWVPPAERPIPLDAFPIFNGHGFKANGKLKFVDMEADLAASSSSNGGGAVNASDAEAGVRAAAGGLAPTSTLLFMHIWKCAGSSLRHLLRDWASLKGQDIGIVVRCTDMVSQVCGTSEFVGCPVR